MKISYEKICKKFATPVANSHGIFSCRESLLVKISRGNADTDCACGECAPWAGFGCEKISEAEEFLAKISNRDLSALPSIPDTLPCLAHAISAAEFFLKNPRERNAPEPPPTERAKLLRRELASAPAELLADAERERNAHGFSVFKVKIGLGEPVEELRFCEKILSNAPAGTQWRFDANGAFSTEILPALVELSAAPALEFFEQALPPSQENDAKIFALAEKTEAKFALDESIREPDSFTFPRGGTRVVAVVKPALSGDFFRLLDWLERTDSDAPPVVISTAFENSPAGRAALFLACSRVAKNRRRAFGLG